MSDKFLVTSVHYLQYFCWNRNSIEWENCENCSKKIYVSDLGFFSTDLTNVDFGQCLVKMTQILVKILISLVRIFWHWNQGLLLTLTELHWLFSVVVLCWPLTGTTLTFVDFVLTDLVIWEGCVTLLAGWPHWDFSSWSILLTVITHQQIYIYLASLLLIYW